MYAFDYHRPTSVAEAAKLLASTPEAKLQSLAETLGTRPSEFWIVFSHVQGAESADILTRLKQNGYTMADWVERRAAGAVLLRQE